MDPIHTVRAAKRLLLKDGLFASLHPRSCFEGHLRAAHGRIAAVGPKAVVEAGETVLEVWGKLVTPGFALAGVDPIELACRAVEPGAAAGARARLEALGTREHRALAVQALAECAVAGVLHPIVDARGAGAARVRGVAEAFDAVGLRGAIEWQPAGAESESLAREIASNALVRIVAGPAGRADLEALARGGALREPAWLSAHGGPPDAWSLLRLAERRAPGLGDRLLGATYGALAAAFGAPFGALVPGAPFDALFLSFEAPGRVDDATIAAFLLEGMGPWHVDGAVVGGVPVVKRHELTKIDTESVARDVAAIVASVSGLPASRTAG